MDRLAVLENLQNDAQAIYDNIEWNLGGLMGMAAIIKNPNLLNLTSAPLVLEVDGLSVDGFQCLGIALLAKDRQNRAEELLAMARRSLLCEALEVAADFLTRAAQVSASGMDPYERDNYSSVDIRDLWNSTTGKAGSLIKQVDREFFEKLVAPLRNFIRHNNGKLPP
jgi:hypothetical protein